MKEKTNESTKRKLIEYKGKAKYLTGTLRSVARGLKYAQSCQN